MGSNNVKAWGEAVLFAVLAFALTYVTIPAGDYAIALAMLPLVFFSLRRGILLGLAAGIVAGVIQFFVASGGSDILENIVTNIAPFAFVGIAGFFAKFTQRTLNNKRFSNAALNIVTASFFGAIVSFCMEIDHRPILSGSCGAWGRICIRSLLQAGRHVIFDYIRRYRCRPIGCC